MTRWTRFATAAKAVIVAAFLVLAISAPAHAGAIIDFSTGLTLAGGGILTVDRNGDVKGDKIAIDLLEVSGTSKDGTYDVDGVLSFDTANNWIRIDGSVSGNGLDIDYTKLLWGTISNFDFDRGLLGVLGAFTATGPDSKDKGLLTALGIDPYAQFQYFGFSIGFDKNPLDSAQTYKVLSADIVNTQVAPPTAVPEPSTISLFGTGLFGLAGAARRRFRR